jgi:hypothetical protein
MALSVDPFNGFMDMRANSLGGSNPAFAEGFSAMLTNPASLAVAKPGFSAARLDLALAGPVFDIASLALSKNLTTAGFASFLSQNNNKLYTAVDLSGPIALGYLGDGLGFGIFENTSGLINISSMSRIKIAVTEELLIVGGYGFRVDLGASNALDFGLIAKGFIRGSTGISGGIMDLYSLMGSSSDIMSELMGQPFTLTTGIGVDLGMRWSWAKLLSVGISCKDAYSPALVSTFSSIAGFAASPSASRVGAPATGLIEPNLAAGVVVTPPLGIFGRVLDGLVISVDYDHILDLAKPVSRNAILNVGLGLEARVLEVLTLRVGIKDALLQAGIDYDLGVARVGVSAWGAELGYEPGSRSVYNLLLGIDFVY